MLKEISNLLQLLLEEKFFCKGPSSSVKMSAKYPDFFKFSNIFKILHFQPIVGKFYIKLTEIMRRLL